MISKTKLNLYRAVPRIILQYVGKRSGVAKQIQDTQKKAHLHIAMLIC